MSLKQGAVGLLQTPAAVLMAVAVGGVTGGMPVVDILVCGLVAACGVALFCTWATRLFGAPVGLDLLGLWEDFAQHRALRFRRPEHVARRAAAYPRSGGRRARKLRRPSSPVPDRVSSRH